MLCHLCKQDSDRIVRVNHWQVCQWCVSNKVLEHALEVTLNIKKLHDAVQKAQVGEKADGRRAKTAQARLTHAYKEAEKAAQDLAAISADSTKSLQESLEWVDGLKEFQFVEDEKSRKPTDGDPLLLLRVRPAPGTIHH